MGLQIMIGKIRKTYGDYQTPQWFSDEVLQVIFKRNINPNVCFEPTCGIGNFIKSAIKMYPNCKGIGIEINSNYAEICQQDLQNKNVKIINDDIFSFQYQNLFTKNDKILIIGNPPVGYK